LDKVNWLLFLGYLPSSSPNDRTTGTSRRRPVAAIQHKMVVNRPPLSLSLSRSLSLSLSLSLSFSLSSYFSKKNFGIGFTYSCHYGEIGTNIR
jgi:hypothetical protein